MPARKSRKPSARDAAYEASLTIQGILNDEAFKVEDAAVWAPKIIAAFKRDADAWYVYDTQLWDQPGFWAARSIRNSPTWGPKLFASFRH